MALYAFVSRQLSLTLKRLGDAVRKYLERFGDTSYIRAAKLSLKVDRPGKSGSRQNQPLDGLEGHASAASDRQKHKATRGNVRQ